MIEILKTIDDKLVELKSIEEGAWIHMTKPDEEEIQYVSENLNIDADYIRAALDEEESSRIETEDGTTFVIVDIPMAEAKDKTIFYRTFPLGIILNDKCIVTVSLKENSIINDFADSKVKSFFTFKKDRFILQLLYRNSTKYLQYLKQIDKVSSVNATKLQKSTRNKELLQLYELEKSMVYFNTSLKANEIVLEKMLRTDSIKRHPEDIELLEDVIIENKQAIEMAKMHTDILRGTMDAFAAIISNNLNMVMKYLTSITIIMAIPTMISSFFGMNVIVPMNNNPYAFLIIFIFAVALCVLSVFVMIKKKML